VRAAAVLSVIAAAFVAVAVAPAQQPAAPQGNYGGGVVVAPSRSLYGAGNMLIGLRARAGELEMNVGMTLSCSHEAQFSARVTPAADGSFRVKGTRSWGRARTRFVVAGTISAAAAAGSATARTSIRRGGHTTRCPVSKVRWQARRATGEIGIPPAAPKERMYGTTSQRLHGPRRAISLRLSSDATKLARALYDVTVRCGRRTITDTYDAPKRNLPIAADGRVRDVERFTFKDRRTIYHSTERFKATIGATGARGTFSTVARIADRRSGRTLVRCRSGLVRWTAST
jgi:hypothetical protein